MPEMEKEANFLGAIARGTVDGLHLALNVGAMLISFLRSARVSSTPSWAEFTHLRIGPGSPQPRSKSSAGFSLPIAWLIGIPWHDCRADRQSSRHAHGHQRIRRLRSNSATMKDTLDPRTFTIATFALCGFANFSSIGIQIGGIGALAPEQRGQLAKFGIRAMLAGTMANLMSASIVGIFS